MKKDIKNSFITLGIINIVIHIPMVILTSFWGPSILGSFSSESVAYPFWYVVSLFPLLIPFVLCILGIIRGSLNLKKHKNAGLCLLLSVIGLFEYIGILILIGWLGSIG